MFKRKSIYGRMFITYAVLLVFVLLITTIAMTFMSNRYTMRKEVETMSSVAKTIEYWTAILQIEQTDAQSYRSYDHVINSWAKFTKSDITVVGRDGNVFNSTSGVKNVPYDMLACMQDNGIKVYKSDFGGFYNKKVMTVAFPLHYKGSVIGAIFFNRDVADIRYMIFELMLMFLFSALISVLLAFGLVYYQAKSITKPLVQLNKAAQMMAAGNFEERVEVTSQDEIGQLASTFNFMASAIQKSDKQKQRFVSDISHELRTPMTSISGFVQGMLDGTIDDDSRDDYLRIVLDESTRLTKLVNDMLEMSKMQSEKFKLDISAFDINELICTCLISLEKRIDDGKLDVNVDFNPDRLMALADKYQIKRVVLNLLDNAIKFSRENSVIQIKTSIADGKVRVEISNTGDKIDEEEIRHLFDRFYKTDISREKDRTGAGLGLSLVQNIIRLHNQTINADSVYDEESDTSTITFTFTLEVN